MNRWPSSLVVPAFAAVVVACSGGGSKATQPTASAVPVATAPAPASASAVASSTPPPGAKQIHCGKNRCTYGSEICCMHSEPGAPPEMQEGVCAPRVGQSDGLPEGEYTDAEYQQALREVLGGNEQSCAEASSNKESTLVFCDSSSECSAGKQCCAQGGVLEVPAHCSATCEVELCGGGDACRGKGMLCRGDTCMLAAEIDCGGVQCGGERVCCNSFATGKATCTDYATCSEQSPRTAPLIEQCDGPKACAGRGFCVAQEGRSRCMGPPINLQISELRCTTDADCSYEGPIGAMQDPGCKIGKCVPGGAGMNLCECHDP